MLDQRHLDHLHSSAISDQIIAERGYVSITPGSVYDWRQIAGSIHSDGLLKQVLHQGGLAFPLRRLGAERPHTWILRPDQPRSSKEGKPIKYEYPKATPNVLDVLPRYQTALGEPAIDIWLTEGAKKADALATSYDRLIVPVNENGVWGWRSKGKLLDDFRGIVWEGRRVVLAPDGDVRHNKAVYQAVLRSARLFTAWGASEVLICLLPDEKGGPKWGVDDFLAAGNSIDQLESHLVELAVVGQQARVSLMRHPTTSQHLYLPPGYDVSGRTIVRRSGETEGQHVYTGLLAVVEAGQHLATKDESVTVAWDRYGQIQTATVPRVSLTTGSQCGQTLGGLGANVHGINARDVSRYLIEFIRENEGELPTFYQTDRLGNFGEGVVLPAGALGFDREVRYTGTPVKVFTDHDAYPLTLREVARWDSLVTFWATFALALAAPILNRMRPDRNPVLLLAQASGSGKTTIVNFAIGAYGDPSIAPMRIQCASPKTTSTGILQTMGQTNGVPLHLEDIHLLMKRDPDRFAGMIYDFANGQLRTYGQLNQQAGGGTRLGGALLMTGEAVPELQFEGSQRRLMTINCRRWLPLGVEPQTDEGGLRALVLNNAVKAGAGSFGHRVAEFIWANWDAIQRDAALLEVDPALSNLQAWRPLLATAAQVLRVALHPIGVELDYQKLLRQWAALYQEGQADRNPAQLAYEKVLMMLGQSELGNNSEESSQGHRLAATWEWLSYDRKVVAARRVGEDYWRVFTTSPQWRQVVGEAAVEMFGDVWLKAGLIRAHTGARQVSDKVYTGPGRGYLQCILIPESQFTEREQE